MSGAVIVLDSDSDEITLATPHAPARRAPSDRAAAVLAECFPGVSQVCLADALLQARGNSDRAAELLASGDAAPLTGAAASPRDHSRAKSRSPSQTARPPCTGSADWRIAREACAIIAEDDGDDDGIDEDDGDIEDEMLMQTVLPRTRLESGRRVPGEAAAVLMRSRERERAELVEAFDREGLPVPNNLLHGYGPDKGPDAARPLSMARKQRLSADAKSRRVAERELTRAQEKQRKAGEREKERARIAAERELAKAERVREKERRQRELNMALFATHEKSTLETVGDNVCIQVPQAFVTGNKESRDARAMLESLLRDRVSVQDDMPADNIVLWRRRSLDESSGDATRRRYVVGEEIPYAVICVDASDLCFNIEYGFVEEKFKHLARLLAGKRMEMVLVGAESYCKRTANNMSRSGAVGHIISGDAVRDACTMLYMEYGISTRHVKKFVDVSRYLVEVTWQLAAAPGRGETTFMDANVGYRYTQSAGTTAGVAVGETWDGSAGSGVVRMETAGDRGVVYLNILEKVGGISKEKAKAIRGEHPTLRALLDAYARCGTQRARDDMLADVRMGSGRQRRIGKAASKVVALVFTSRDANAFVHVGSSPGDERDDDAR
jgi:hypothetical protein